jgi:hypothetical protein
MTTVQLNIGAQNQAVNWNHGWVSDGDGLRIDSREVGLFSSQYCSLNYLH